MVLLQAGRRGGNTLSWLSLFKVNGDEGGGEGDEEVDSDTHLASAFRVELGPCPAGGDSGAAPLPAGLSTTSINDDERQDGDIMASPQPASVASKPCPPRRSLSS
jgi:hypothetical protein